MKQNGRCDNLDPKLAVVKVEVVIFTYNGSISFVFFLSKEKKSNKNHQIGTTCRMGLTVPKVYLLGIKAPQAFYLYILDIINYS